MTTMNEMNSSLTNSVNNNNFLRECIELAIDGFLFRGVTPSDHYYRFSQSFPKAFTLNNSYLNQANSSSLATPKQVQRHHHSSSSSTAASATRHSAGQQQRLASVPLLDLSSLNNNVVLEQQPVSTILSTQNNSGLTIKTKKSTYSPKDVSTSILY